MAAGNTIEDLVKNNLCTGCGACASESNGALEMKWDEFGFLVPTPVNNKKVEGDVIRVCPFNPAPTAEVRDEDKLSEMFLGQTSNFDPLLGRFDNTYVGYANEYRITSSSGGVASYVFEQLLQRGIVNHLYIVKELNGTYEYQFFNSIEAIKKISKTRYIPVTLENLFIEINKLDGKVAVSGVSCFIKAIRLKQYYHPELREKIPFLVGIICGGWKSRSFTEYMVQRSGINGTYSKQEYRVKDLERPAIDYSFGAFDEHEEFHQIKVKNIGDLWGSGLFKANACDFCDDVTTELADISVGDAWINPYNQEGSGNNVLITRSPLANQILKEGIRNGNLTITVISTDKFKESQAASFKHRQMALKYRLDTFKKSGVTTPYKRTRFFQHIPFEFKVVQKLRMLIRKQSLEEWKAHKDSVQFDRNILVVKTKLAKMTKWYQRIQKIKKKLHLKTL
jgi:coenzyme F420 hydrogenase subunit beta